MGEQRIKRVVIAGGGTAGWLAAAALTRQLGHLLDIVLIESEEIGTVGVGESTIPTVRSFHALIGVDEREFLRATKATFKLGISFENWARDGDRYIHSFGTVGKSTWMADFQHFWLEARAQGQAGELGDYCLEHEAARADRFTTGDDGGLNYAYHLDASQYAQFLRKLCEARGLNRIEGKIASVDRDAESGNIAALVMESGARVEGDLFIDCTGFRGLLIEQTLGAGYEDWGHWLPTDSALAVQTTAVGPAVPYTRAIAHDAGWRWQIPLQHRVGNGLVYSSEYLSEHEARARLLAGVEGEPLFDPRLIRFRTGRRRRAWIGNCVALSLASGFVEPLESTSIHLIMIGVTRLLQLFPFEGIDPALVDRFNDQSRDELERVRDFIILHYHLNERPEPFWQRMREMEIPDSLAARIDLFRGGAHAYQSASDLFRVDSWLQVMLGQRLEPEQYHHVARMMPPGQLGKSLGDIKARIAVQLAHMPTHQAFLDSYCAPVAAAESGARLRVRTPISING
ncbi:tryptophan halogenase family protein [Sphingomonas radiodurans]|uniref:tryptophan halogenase family protein n=1 Tax=Sphingomonas radiodurans TaxID=2890321 RepID=UPI001E57DF3E|nr:tryptophan halogenase family protein [Sphingomonas radiodurans]WBH15529.1 tryptophan 7-halogenase [Sphingomonas radiodurans]